MCKRYGGFLRVALADPLPERRWFRRGWVTFRRDVNIKDICWNLNNIRVRLNITNRVQWSIKLKYCKYSIDFKAVYNSNTHM